MFGINLDDTVRMVLYEGFKFSTIPFLGKTEKAKSYFTDVLVVVRAGKFQN